MATHKIVKAKFTKNINKSEFQKINSIINDQQETQFNISKLQKNAQQQLFELNIESNKLCKVFSSQIMKEKLTKYKFIQYDAGDSINKLDRIFKIIQTKKKQEQERQQYRINNNLIHQKNQVSDSENSQETRVK